MRRAKIFSAISLVILCICMLCVGVISASGVKEEVGMGGVINVPANKIGVVVKGYIGHYTEMPGNGIIADFDSSATAEDFDDADKDENGDYKTQFGDKWTFTNKQLEKMVFDLSDVNTEQQLLNKTITITFFIINNSQIELEAYFTKLEKEIPTKVTELNLQHETKNTIKVNFYGCEQIPVVGTINNGNIGIVSIVFSPLRFVESSATLNFDYTLNVVEKPQS